LTWVLTLVEVVPLEELEYLVAVLRENCLHGDILEDQARVQHSQEVSTVELSHMHGNVFTLESFLDNKLANFHVLM
jgi:hypothetical protein